MPGPGYKAKSKGGSGYTGKKKKKPSYSSPRATLGGKDVARTTEQTKKKVSTPRAALGGADVRKTTRQARKARKRSIQRARKQQARALRKTMKATRPKVSKPTRTSDVLKQIRREEKGVFEGSSLKEDLGLIKEIVVPDSPAELGVSLIPIGGKLLTTARKLSKLKSAGTKVNKVEKAGNKARQAEKAGKVRRAKRARKKEARAAQKQREKSAKREERLERKTRQKEMGRAKEVWKRRKPAVATRAGRQVKRRKKATVAAAAGAASPPVAMMAAGTVQSTGEAALEDPKQVGKTTARVIPGAAAGLVGLGANVGAAGYRALPFTKGDPLEPLKGEAKAQKRYWELVGKAATGDKDVIKEDLGLVPLATGALTGLGLAKTFKQPRHSLRQRRNEGIKEKLRSPDERVRAKGKKKQQRAKKLDVAERKRQRKRSAEDEAVTRQTTDAVYREELKKTGRGRKKLDRKVARLSQRKIGKGVSLADAIPVFGREGLDPDDPNLASELRAIRADLVAPSKQIDTDSMHTRRVLDAAIKTAEDNPAVFRDPEFSSTLEGFRNVMRDRQMERHGERMGIPSRPDPEDERARLLHVAQREGVNLPEERIPTELRPLTKLKPRQGEVATKRVKGEARSLRNRAKRLEAQAVALRKSRPERSQVLDSRAKRYRAHADTLEAGLPQARFKRAEGLEIEADKLDAQGHVQEALDLRAQAAKLRREGMASSARLRDEFIEETKSKAPEKARRAFYVRELDVTDQGDMNVLLDFPGNKIPPKEKMRLGKLAKEGRIDESAATLMENLYRARVAMERRAQARRLVRERLVVDGKSIFTGPQARALERAGEIPPGYALMTLQEFERVFQKGKWENAADLSQLADQVIRDEIMASKRVKGKKYIALNEARLREFRAQMEPPNQAIRALRNVGRTQSLAILATSPAWFAFQLFATPFAAVASRPALLNPYNWAKLTKRAIIDYRKLSPKERARFKAQFGGTTADAIDFRSTQAILAPDSVRAMSDAANVALKTPVGRFLDAAWKHAKRGGPLIAANRKYEAGIRTVYALLEAERIRNPSKVVSFIQRTAGLQDIVRRHANEVSKLSPSEQLRYYANNPDKAAELQRRVNDALGNWTALSSKERLAAATTVFYPFLRFSLRWLFKFPQNKPFTAAVLLNLSQQNAEELRRLLGEPSFFPDWGLAIANTGPEGQPAQVFNSARINPASNALIESLGGDATPFALALRPFQPIIGGTVAALAGKNPFTGQDDNRPILQIIADQIVSLPSPARPFVDDIGLKDRSRISEVFQTISGRDADSVRDTLVPQLFSDVFREKEAARVGRVLDKSKSVDDSPAIARMLSEVESSPEPTKEIARRFGKEQARNVRKSVKARGRLKELLTAYGLDDTEAEEALDIYFDFVTPARFGNKPAKKTKTTTSTSSSSGSAYQSTFGGGSGSSGGGTAYEQAFGKN